MRYYYPINIWIKALFYKISIILSFFELLPICANASVPFSLLLFQKFMKVYRSWAP